MDNLCGPREVVLDGVNLDGDIRGDGELAVGQQAAAAETDVGYARRHFGAGGVNNHRGGGEVVAFIKAGEFGHPRFHASQLFSADQIIRRLRVTNTAPRIMESSVAFVSETP